MARILIVEDHEPLRFTLGRALAKPGHEAATAATLREAREMLAASDYAMVLTDLMVGGDSGIDLIRELRGEGYDGVIVLMTAYGTIETAVAAMREGADDFIQKPISHDELTIQVERWIEHRRMAQRLRLYERMERAASWQELVGESEAWRRTLLMATKLARLPLWLGARADGGGGEGALGSGGLGGGGSRTLPCILILGETGVGKGVLARYIHEQSVEGAAGVRGEGAERGSSPLPFVHVNCSALPGTLVEAELFGHEKGAFTDAREARPGLFEMADGGTIFLDEISEMPPELQAKLLLVVEEGVFRRVGGARERTVRARVIAASNQDLEQRATAGVFRRDLLYRLNAFTLTVPPLRDRRDDALLIAESTLKRLARRYGRAVLTLGPSAVEAIREHHWPGNVRELVNAAQRAAMLADSPQVTPESLGLERAVPLAARPRAARETGAACEQNINPDAPGGEGDLRFDFEKGVHTAELVERALLMQALDHTRGNISKAARLIGMQRSSFRYRIERYGLDAYVSEAAKR